MLSAEKKEKRILWFSLCGGLLFALVEFGMAIYSHSQSVLMDATYDFVEVLATGFMLFLTPLFYKPITEERPYGYLQIEPVFVVIKGVMMLAVSFGLAINTIQIAFAGGNSVKGSQVSIFELILGSISLLLLLYMRHLSRNAKSPMVEAELYGWKMDVVYSAGMTIAFFISHLLKYTPLAPLMPYFDPLIAVLVVIVMLPEAIRMLIKALRSMFLFAPENAVTERVKELCNEIMLETPFEANFYDIIRTGRRLWVSVYFRSKDEMLSQKELRQLSEKINAALRKEFDDCRCELVPRL